MKTKKFSLCPLTLAIVSTFMVMTGAVYAQTVNAPINSDQAFSSETLVEGDGLYNVVGKVGGTLNLTLNSDAKLSLTNNIEYSDLYEYFVNDSGLHRNAISVVNAGFADVNFEGQGTVVISMNDLYAGGPSGILAGAESLINCSRDSKVASGGSLGDIIFGDDVAVELSGSLASGILLRPSEGDVARNTLTAQFNNGLSLNLDRTNAFSGAANVMGIGANFYNIEIHKTASSINLKAGARDRGLQGIVIGRLGNLTITAPLTITLDGQNNDSVIGGLHGIQFATTINPDGVFGSQNPTTPDPDVTINGPLTINLKDAPKSQAYGFHLSGAERDYTFNDTITVNSSNVKYAYGLYSSQNTATQDIAMNLEAASQAIGLYLYGPEAQFSSDNVDITVSSAASTAIYARENAQYTAKSAHLVATGASDYGIRVTGDATNDYHASVTVTDSLSVTGPNPLRAANTGTIDIQKDFIANTDNAYILADGGNIRLNSSGAGTVQFNGRTEVTGDGSIEMNLGTSGLWNATSYSSLTGLSAGVGSNLLLAASTADINSGTALLTVSGTEAVHLAYDVSSQEGSKITVYGEGIQLQKGDRIDLIYSNAGFTLNNEVVTAETDLSGLKGDMDVTSRTSLFRVAQTRLASNAYDLVFDEDSQSLIATIEEKKPVTPENPQPLPSTALHPETDALMQSSVAALTSLFAMDDLLIDTALKSSSTAPADTVFAAVRGGKWSFDAGAGLDADVYSAILGWTLKADSLTFGPFIEIGHSDYDTETREGSLRHNGSGSQNFVGGGLYAKWQMPYNMNLTGYVKGGVIENNFGVTLAGQKMDFDRSSAYWGAHLGAHWNFVIDDGVTIRPFVSYFYDGRASESFRQGAVGDVAGAFFEYDALNAHRIQVGSMFEVAYSQSVRPYFGMTLENVISAEAKGSATDGDGTMSLKSSDLEGTTGIVAAGLSYLDPAGVFEFNFGINGYTGAREGASAQASARWNF